jgi:hypothetical protein
MDASAAAPAQRAARPTSPSRPPKTIRSTKPRGLDEDTAAPPAFPKGKASSSSSSSSAAAAAAAPAVSLLLLHHHHHADVPMDAAVWAGLPDDLLLEVLARVPPFLLFRLRTVSRRWEAVLRDPAFLARSALPRALPPHLLQGRRRRRRGGGRAAADRGAGTGRSGGEVGMVRAHMSARWFCRQNSEGAEP